MTLADLKKESILLIKKSGSPSPILDVNCLLQFFLKCSLTYILANPLLKISDEQCKEFFTLVKKREQGLPIAYITGIKEFYLIDFFVTQDVLIPKPDTEVLVEKAIEKILSYKKSNKNQNEISVVDVCTGSGCIGLSTFLNCTLSEQFKLNQKKVNLTLTDLSQNALEVAKKNAKKICDDNNLNFSKIEFLNGDLLCNKKNVDFILSNPPYVPHTDVEELLKDGRNEPQLALDGDIDFFVDENLMTSDGLSIIKRLVPMAFDALNDGGYFFMESGEYQIEEVKKLFLNVGFSKIEILYDLSNQPRVTVGKKQI